MSWEESVNVANVLGVRAICVFNDYRERLVGSRLTQAQNSGLGTQNSAVRASDPK